MKTCQWTLVWPPPHTSGLKPHSFPCILNADECWPLPIKVTKAGRLHFISQYQSSWSRLERRWWLMCWLSILLTKPGSWPRQAQEKHSSLTSWYTQIRTATISLTQSSPNDSCHCDHKVTTITSIHLPYWFLN